MTGPTLREALLELREALNALPYTLERAWEALQSENFGEGSVSGEGTHEPQQTFRASNTSTSRRHEANDYLRKVNARLLMEMVDLKADLRAAQDQADHLQKIIDEDNAVIAELKGRAHV